MDIAAHMLWVGAAGVLLTRRAAIRRRTVVGAVALAGLPDVLQLVPVLCWVGFDGGSWQALIRQAIAVPGREPPLPEGVAVASHHLHCIAHSAVVAGAVTAVTLAVLRAFWLPLLGWWSHIVIDVFTHSADFYAVPVLYPITYRGFDGVAWNEPWLMALNYAALALAWLWVLRRPSG